MAQQHGDHAGMTILRRLHYGGTVHMAARLDLRAAPQQELDDIHMPFSRRDVQRRGLGAQSNVYVGAIGQQQLQNLGMTATCRHMHRRVAADGAGADIGTPSDQEPDDLDLARVCRHVERRRLVDPRARIDVLPLLKEINREFQVAGRGGLMEYHVGHLDPVEHCSFCN